ncbi:protein tantalus [Lucilia sericata]|uniref:protein tantalus n=1 Tax=Lucilia sericata TaxID=13632 RepID=UPI0018A85D53|nr:protein tantalus [Lucilia sericata]
MEGIVVGIAQINFHQNLSGIADENSSPNFAIESSANMTTAESYLLKAEELPTICEQDVGDGTVNNLIETDTTGDSGWEEVEDDEEKCTRNNKRGYTLAERRQMPTRASKESSLLGIKRRTIMKPSKRVRNTDDFQNLKPADIKKIYLNKKLTNFKPSSLETIFEEATTTTQNNEQDYSRLMGGRKIKRALSCTDGFRYSKTLVNKRRAKIKKTFGKRFALKKISLEEFITKLNDSIEKNDNETNSTECQEQREDESNYNETATQFSCSEMFVSNISAQLEEDDAMMPNNIPTTGLEIELSNEMSL